jgi:hypothetical protein
MARQFLTGLNLNKNELLNAKIQNLPTSQAPSSPVKGQIFFDTDLNQLKVWDGTAWLALAAGGNVGDAIASAINALDTDDIEEGVSNLYYTESRAKTDAAELLTGATKTNITITGDGSGLTITAENGVADSDTDDLTEGSTNLYFTDSRAVAAAEAAATSADTAGKIVKRDEFGNFAANEVTFGAVNVGDAGYVSDEGTTLAIGATTGNDLSLTGDTGVTIASANGNIVLNPDGDAYVGSASNPSNEIVIQGRLDSYLGDNTVDGSTGNTVADRISSVAGNLSTHINDNSAHGTTGDVVGTTDSQTLTNKTLGTGTVLSANVDANTYTITDLGAPSADSDAATKLYVDTEILDHAGYTNLVHGVNGDIVGTSDTQTLTNKTLGSGNALSADLDADGNTITNLPTPTNSSDAATKGYVDNAVAGLTWKPAVHLLATSNIALTGDTETLVIDGHAALGTSHVGYRILLTNQSTDSQNGIYVYADTGSTYTLTRSADADVYTELKGATVFVQEGTTYGQSAWTQGNTYLTDFTNQDWVQFSGAAQIVAGAGLTKDGNTLDVVGTSNRITVHADNIDISTSYVGQSSITTLGTITTGVWNGTDIAVADGGTGASTAAGARQNLGATTKYTEANPELTVSSGEVTWTVTHNLGIRTVVVQVYDTEGFDSVEVDVERTNTSTVTLKWPAAATVTAGAYQVVIVG